jgi:hypothetical protein
MKPVNTDQLLSLLRVWLYGDTAWSLDGDIERPKILIVDDQPRNLDVLEVMLTGSTVVRSRELS